MDNSQNTEQETIPKLLQLLLNKEDTEIQLNALRTRCDNLEFRISALNKSINFTKIDLRNFKIETSAKIKILEIQTTKLMDESFINQVGMSFENPGEEAEELPGGGVAEELPEGEEKL